MNFSSLQKIPSVKRRYTGPYLPCPRAKKVALNSKQNEEAEKLSSDSKTDDSNTDECIDFAVETPKKKDIESVKTYSNNVEVIESDDEIEEVQHNLNLVQDIQHIVVEEAQPGVIEVSNEDVGTDARLQSLQNFVEIPDDPFVDNSVSVSDEECVVESTVISDEQQTKTEKSKASVLKDCTCPNTKLSPGKYSLPKELSPQVCLVQLKNIDLEHQLWKTYTVFGFQLRCFKILVKDCWRNSIASLPQTPPQTPPHNTDGFLNKTGQQFSKTISTPEFTERYEDCVAEKLLSVRKRLDAPVKTVPNQINKSPAVVFVSGPEESAEKRPVHPRARLRLSPTKSPTQLRKSTCGAFSYMQRTSEIVELSDSDSDSDSDSESSSICETEDETIIIKTEDDDYITWSDDSQNEIKSEEEDEYSDNDDNIDNSDGKMNDASEQIEPKVESEVKQEKYVEPSVSFISDEDMDNLMDAYHQVKRKNKSEQMSLPTLHALSTPDVKPSLISTSIVSPSVSSCELSTRCRSRNSVGVSPSSRKKGDKNKRLTIEVVKLPRETIENLKEHCSSVLDWNNKESLKNAGLTSFDIDRLGIVASSRQHSNYRLRQRKKRFEVNVPVEKPKPLSAENIIPIDTKELKRLKRKRKKKEREERKQMERDSIRRALLKINNRIMNQNKFWGFLNKGSSQSCPIIL